MIRPEPKPPLFPYTTLFRSLTPGLIDLHAHVFPYGSGIGIPADELVPFQATTTLVSAGDAGANNIAAFRRAIVGRSEEHTSELQSHVNLVCRLLLEKKNNQT